MTFIGYYVILIGFYMILKVHILYDFECAHFHLTQNVPICMTPKVRIYMTSNVRIYMTTDMST